MGNKSPPNLHSLVTCSWPNSWGVGRREEVEDSPGSYVNRLRTLLWLAVYVLLISTVSLPSACRTPGSHDEQEWYPQLPSQPSGLITDPDKGRCQEGAGSADWPERHHWEVYTEGQPQGQRAWPSQRGSQSYQSSPSTKSGWTLCIWGITMEMSRKSCLFPTVFKASDRPGFSILALLILGQDNSLVQGCLKHGRKWQSSLHPLNVTSPTPQVWQPKTSPDGLPSSGCHNKIPQTR